MTKRAFHKELLKLVGELDYPVTTIHAEMLGPWRVEPAPESFRECGALEDGWAVRRDGQEKPVALTRHFDTAAMLAAVLPMLGTNAAFLPMAGGYEMPPNLDSSPRPVIRYPGDPPGDIEHELETVRMIASCPRSLAWLLSAASEDTLERAGDLLLEHLEMRRSERGW